MRIKHDYKTKFNMELLKGKIVMAFTDPLDTLMKDYTEDMEKDNYKYFTDNFTGEGIHGYYIFDTIKDFLLKWEEIYDKPNGMWYWCLNDGVCFCSGACDPDDIKLFEEYFKLKRVYCEDGAYYPINDDINKEWLSLATMEEKAKEILSEEEYRVFIDYSHRIIREMFGIPNKIFGIQISNDETEARIILFPKEYDGALYELHIDEELDKPYILIDEE